MKKKLFAILLCFAIIGSALALTGCGSDEGEKLGDAEEVVTLKVGMVGKDIKTACIIIAEELGYFDEAGIDVQFEKINSLPDGLTAVSLDKLDILPFGSIPSCSYISQGTDVVIFGGTISEGSEGIVKGNETYTDLSQFEGKKFGCFRMETGHMIMKGLLREAGVNAEFIYLDSSQSIVEAVNKGEVDIGMDKQRLRLCSRADRRSHRFSGGRF